MLRSCQPSLSKFTISHTACVIQHVRFSFDQKGLMPTVLGHSASHKAQEDVGCDTNWDCKPKKSQSKLGNLHNS